MIFQRNIDKEYKPWFAWYPVKLYGPQEWDRSKFTSQPPRWVWLQTVGRMRIVGRTYYALAD